ncbi:hypothetical protein QR680_003281 [Steinernema hermaphroditum]|uniref:Uncharacterized protein n=1 Tax=Steinernema hermaphroditum TaxID=289476 RepID=A0AA39LJW9_9BILA|nr:hypothetical protein QR680_003281 [Steinernema hermaphroditum]
MSFTLSNMRTVQLQYFSALIIVFVVITETSARPSLADLYSQLQLKAMASSIMRDDPIPVAPAASEAAPKPFSPHLKKLRQGYKLPIHGLDVVTQPPVTAQDKGQPNPKSAAHIINRLSSVLLRI